MAKEPYLAHSELTHEIYIVSGRNKYLVTDQAVKAVKAIQALSQEPTEKPMTVDEMEREYEKSKALFHKIVECDDAISRDMALEKMADYVASGYADSAEDFEEYSRIICQLPSVTQKSGHWIKAKPWMIDNTSYKWECSECKKSERFRHNYCPNCGAKMESEDRTE